jgi:hypothetical protein
MSPIQTRMGSITAWMPGRSWRFALCYITAPFVLALLEAESAEEILNLCVIIRTNGGMSHEKVSPLPMAAHDENQVSSSPYNLYDSTILDAINSS